MENFARLTADLTSQISQDTQFERLFDSPASYVLEIQKLAEQLNPEEFNAESYETILAMMSAGAQANCNYLKKGNQ